MCLRIFFNSFTEKVWHVTIIHVFIVWSWTSRSKEETLCYMFGCTTRRILDVSFSWDTLPYKWKLAETIPLHKKKVTRNGRRTIQYCSFTDVGTVGSWLSVSYIVQGPPAGCVKYWSKYSVQRNLYCWKENHFRFPNVNNVSWLGLQEIQNVNNWTCHVFRSF